MKKMITLTVVLVALLTVFYGCASNGDTTNPPALNSNPTTAATTATTTQPTTQSVDPTTDSTTIPTTQPTTIPTTMPTADPTTQPVTEPTLIPTTISTTVATTKATTVATTKATTVATTKVTTAATTKPTTKATTAVTTKATTKPTTRPTTRPTTKPNITTTTAIVTTVPTTKPTTAPTTVPTTQPTVPQNPMEAERGAHLKILIPGHNSKNPSLWQNKVVNQFVQQYPTVTVEFVNATWADWYEKFMAAYHAGDPIDLINDGVNNNPKFPLMGLTQPLEDYIDMNNPNLHLNSMDECFKYGGHYYVAASETNFAVIYYNKDLFAAAGLDDPMDLYNRGQWNWYYFVEMATQLTDKENGKFGFSTEFPYLFYGSNATATMKLDATGKYSLNMDDPAFQAALEMIRDGSYTSGWSGWNTSAMSTFQDGKSAMLGSWTMYEGDINAVAELFGWPPINYGVVPLPYGPNNTQGLNMVHSAGWAIGAGSDCPHHVGKLIDMLVDGHAAYQAEQNTKLPSAHVALYKEMGQKLYCVNTRDSAIGGGYELAGEVANGTSIHQAIAKYKPEYQYKIDEINP